MRARRGDAESQRGIAPAKAFGEAPEIAHTGEAQILQRGDEGDAEHYYKIGKVRGKNATASRNTVSLS